MKLGPSLELRQTQRLSMTPQLRQALAVLQMNQHSLHQLLREELDKNPLLVAEDDLPPPRPAPLAPNQTSASSAAPDMDSFPASATTLAAHLAAQIGMMQVPKDQAALALLLTQELEPDGYLRAPLAEIAARHDAPQAAVAAALTLLQSCEPAGVGARDLAECLSLQLAERGALCNGTKAVLRRLDLVAANKHEALCKLSGLSGPTLHSLLDSLRKLDPRPGAAFEADAAAIIVPEIIVRRDSFGQWQCELNQDTLPRLGINTTYATALGRADGDSAAFTQHWSERADWLLRALTQRAANILKVARAIVEHQSHFFENGPLEMRPLSLREIAETTKLSESTVSRAVSGKYLTCRAGTFELRYFFTAGLNATSGEARFGAVAIRARIKRLIEAEDQKNPLSDDDLVKYLRAGGVDIARRTVAKYRGSMGISTSLHRRRQYASTNRMGD
ncbi:RNA polymerase factor sigma-54 [Abyssibius alkaniclasticus]|uniref:RNA polymerase factor sigma-54 n=1 Tax=Abyssibius alkaniclasticus TaxID=2881234 RepID=UPI004058F039